MPNDPGLPAIEDVGGTLITYRTTPHLIHLNISRQRAKSWCDPFLESSCLQHALPENRHTLYLMFYQLSGYTALVWLGEEPPVGIGMLGHSEVGGICLSPQDGDYMYLGQEIKSFVTDGRHVSI